MVEGHPDNRVAISGDSAPGKATPLSLDNTSHQVALNILHEVTDLGQASSLSWQASRALDSAKPLTASQKQALESEKTLGGRAIGKLWDLAAGPGDTDEGRAARAQKADQYAEIAADTVASIPKLGAIAGGTARSLLLVDVSGQKSAAQIASGIAFNFAEGAALNSVSRLASGEGAFGRAVTNRLGTGLGAEVVGHAASGAGFGLVKSAMSGATWQDAQGNLNLGGGLKNVFESFAAGGAIGVPAGMAGLRVGRAVTYGLGNQIEKSAVAQVVQRVATGSGAGFAGGAVFGGVDALRQGQSFNQVMDSTWQGGAIGFLTGGLTSGLTRSPILTERLPVSRTLPESFGLSSDRMLSASAEKTPSNTSKARDLSKLSLTDRISEKSEALSTDEARRLAYERLTYKADGHAIIAEIFPRMEEPIAKMQFVSRLKAGAPEPGEPLRNAVAKLKGDKELDFDEHFWKPFMETREAPVRIYRAEGLPTKIVVPEEYAARLDQVRELRRRVEKPSAWDRLNIEEKADVTQMTARGDARALSRYMSATEVTEYLKVYNAAKQLNEHPYAFRALPEDVVTVLDALPNRNLIKEVILHDERSNGDSFRAVKYDSKGFQAAALVGTDGSVSLFQASYGARLQNTMFHEYSHLVKWTSPTFSKIFDLSTVVDRQGQHVDHQATAFAQEKDGNAPYAVKKAIFYPDLHSTRSQDENFAVGLGEELLAPDPDRLFTYSTLAPVRTLAMSSALELQVRAAGVEQKSNIAANLLDRAEYTSDVVRPAALRALQDHLEVGTPAERAAAAQLMQHYGTSEQAGDLLLAIRRPDNQIVPDWKGTAAEEAMQGDTRTVAQHAMDALLGLDDNGRPRSEAEKVNSAMRLIMHEFSDSPLKAAAFKFVEGSSDPRAAKFATLAATANLGGSFSQKNAAIELLRQFGGENASQKLLAIALNKENQAPPPASVRANQGSWLSKVQGMTVASNDNDSTAPQLQKTSVSQNAYDAYLETMVPSRPERWAKALEIALDKPNQRHLAATYLANSWDVRYKAYGQFLEMYDMPGHVNKMQELIQGGLKRDPKGQAMVFERMMRLTDGDPQKHLELIATNLSRSPALRDRALAEAEAAASRGLPTPLRKQLTELLSALPPDVRGNGAEGGEPRQARIDALTDRLARDARVEEAIMLLHRGPREQITGMHELTAMQDIRAIKPLLQQAVSTDPTVAQEATRALASFNPAMVKYYAQELKREYFANPTMTSKISNLLSSRRISQDPIR